MCWAPWSSEAYLPYSTGDANPVRLELSLSCIPGAATPTNLLDETSMHEYQGSGCKTDGALGWHKRCHGKWCVALTLHYALRYMEWYGQ